MLHNFKNLTPAKKALVAFFFLALMIIGVALFSFIR
jgi:hypothetical protein